MTRSARTSAARAARDAVPFLVITAIWIVVMLAVYGLFLASKPGDVAYGPSIHASVFVPPLVGFLGHTVHEIRQG